MSPGEEDWFGLNISILNPLLVVIAPNTCVAAEPDTAVIVSKDNIVIVGIVCV